ncbi:hypothetical protein REJC140_03401 [Pseudorhizobium endolithicum]|uniref:DUF2231 domain-containing protein n=1 Tax=Pseudorhizobium endolithicum TaxID=1191678 RepID=A0ABM8PKS3_9HYPH|nr:DUF2231 domain-containing protein [Pseudorhizobium endolithicum]CAD7035374.1 hypothetical protein REJC140_03401 [Pseudorhizobium endolithicum]
MSDPDLLGISTTARLNGHPVHPLLVPLPIGFFVATLLCDLAFWWSRDALWLTAGFWALLVAICTAALAAVAGFADFAGNRRVRAIKDAWRHMIGNVVAVLLAIGSLALRWSGDASAVLPWGLSASILIFLLIFYTGWKGGELSYRHRVGVLPDEADPGVR